MERFIQIRRLDEPIDYTGDQLRSHFIRERAGIEGDGLIAFIGACRVSGDRLVDLEDAERGSRIEARSMLHFIGEHFQRPLAEANVRLRLFSSIVAEALSQLAPGVRVSRRGDDLFVGSRKLSVAICTVSPVSALFHFGVNVDPSGAPVPAIGLAELGVGTEELAERSLAAYAEECESLERAVRKVRGVP